MEQSAPESNSECGMCKCDCKQLLATLKDVFTRPKELFAGIKSSDATAKSLLMTYLLPLSVISAIAGVITWMTMGGGFFSSLVYSVVQAVVVLAVVILSSKILSMPAVSGMLGGEYSDVHVLHLFSLVWVPAALGQVLSAVIPGVGWLISFLLAFYCLYLFYIGAKEGLGVNPIMFIVAAILISIVLSIVFGMIQTFLIGGPPISPAEVMENIPGLSEEQLKSIENLKNMAEKLGAQTAN